MLVLLGLHAGFPRGHFAGAAPPETSFPDTPSGIALARWLDAYNTGRPDSMQTAIQSLYAPYLLQGRSATQRAQSLRLWWKNYGAFRVARFDTVRPFSIVASVHEDLTDGWGGLYFDVDTTAPHGITGVGLVPFQEPPSWNEVKAPASDAALAQQLEALAGRLATEDAFSGVVLVTKQGIPLLRRAFGNADAERSMPNTPETQFELASTSKMFTAVAIAQLADRGKLAFTDPVSKFLPEFPALQAGAKISVHHLLTMSSGLPDLFRSPRYWRSRGAIRALADTGSRRARGTA